MANKLNNCFTNVAANLAKTIKKPITRFQDYLQNPNESSLFLKETTPDEIQDIINNLDSKKSTDIYGISSHLKIAGPTLSKILTIIFNKSITEGIFPIALEVAKVIPIHQGESIFEVSNYRPISFLPIFGKILEKLMFTERLYPKT